MRIKERLFEDVYSRLEWYTVKIRQTYAVHSDVVISQKTGWLYEGRGGEGRGRRGVRSVHGPKMLLITCQVVF